MYARELGIKAAADAEFYNNLLKGIGRAVPIVGAGAGLLAGELARHAWENDTKIPEKKINDMVQKNLGDHSVAVPVPGMGNASYQSVDFNGNKWHLVKYDPNVGQSAIAHEIGHGMGRIPRVPFADLIGPSMMLTGAYNSGLRYGMGAPADPLMIGLGLGGLAITAPTLLDEWMASHRAKKILQKENLKPHGLRRAWGTYAVPTALAAGLGLTGYGIGSAAYNDGIRMRG